MATNENGFWSGFVPLNISNTGPKGASVNSVSHELVGFRNGNEIVDDIEGTELEEGTGKDLRARMTIDAESTKLVSVNFRIRPKEDIGVLIRHDAAIIKHTIVIEDNKGAYEVTHKSEMALTGPTGIGDEWDEE